MLHRDFLEDLIENFSSGVQKHLLEAYQTTNPNSIYDLEGDIARLLELNQSFALNLSPDSLVVMLQLNGVGYEVARYAAFALHHAAVLYSKQNNQQMSELRQSQADALARSFGFDGAECPKEFVQLESQLEQA